MTESEAIKEVRFNMSTIGLSNEAAKRVVEARDMAINALEKQIAKKPIPVIDKTFGIIYSFMCPYCNYEGLGNNECRFARCENCGQKLDCITDSIV